MLRVITIALLFVGVAIAFGGAADDLTPIDLAEDAAAIPLHCYPESYNMSPGGGGCCGGPPLVPIYC